MAGILPECIVRVLLCRHNSHTISAHWQQPMHGCVGSYWSETQDPSVFSRDSLRTQCRQGNCLLMVLLHEAERRVLSSCFVLKVCCFVLKV
jgi:hypothetical protein